MALRSNEKEISHGRVSWPLASFVSVPCFCSRQALHCYLRSFEHDSAFTSSLGAHIAQIGWQASTDGVEVRDSTLKPLKAVLEAIRRDGRL
jgi:hypothetical protein